MDKKVIILLIFILFALLIAIMQAKGLIDITSMFSRKVKEDKPSVTPHVEFLQPPAHGYHPVYYNGEEYYTYVVFRTKEYIEYTPSIVTSFPLKGNPVLLVKYQDDEGYYVYELLLKTSKIKTIGESLRIGQYVVTFYPEIEDVSDKWGIEILSPTDGSTYDLDSTNQITVYVLNKYNGFTYTSGSILIGGEVAPIISASLLTEEGEESLQSGVVVDSGDVFKFVIDVSGQTAGQKVLTVNIDTQSHGTLSDSVNIVFEGGTPLGAGIQITDILIDGETADSNGDGVYEIPIDEINNVEVVAEYSGDPITVTQLGAEAHSTPVTLEIAGLKQLRLSKIITYMDRYDPTMLQQNPLYLEDKDQLYIGLMKTSLDAIADGAQHTLYIKVYNSETGEWLEDSVLVKITKASLQIQLLQPDENANVQYDDTISDYIDEVINVNDLDYGLYEVRWKNIGEREIYMSDAIVKFTDVTNPDNVYLVQPATPVEGTIVDVNKEAVFYINLVKAGVPSGYYKITLLIFDKNQATPIEAPEQPVIQLIVPEEKIQLISPQPYATINAEEQNYVNAVVENAGEEAISMSDVRFYWIPLDENGQPIDSNKVMATIQNYDDILNTYSTFNPGDQFTATIDLPPLTSSIEYYMLAVEVYKSGSSTVKLSDSVQPIIIYKKCAWQFRVYSVTDDGENGDPLSSPDVWDRTVGAYKEIILENTGEYPIKFSGNDITITLYDEITGDTITLPILNRGSLSPDSGTTYWYPGKTLQLITSVIGVPPGTYTLKVSMKNYIYCADELVKEDTPPHREIEVNAPKTICGDFLTILSPTDNTYIDLSKLDEDVGRAGIMRVSVDLDTVGLSESTGQSEFKMERISVILKDASGNIVYMFTPRTEILNYDDVISKTYTVTDHEFELIIDAGGLVHAGLLDQPLTLEVSAFLPGVDCYDFDNKDNIYFIYPDNKVFEAVLTKYAVPSDGAVNDIQYDNGAIISPESIVVSAGTVPKMKVYAINDAGDYDKDGKQSTMPVIIQNVGKPQFYDPDHKVVYYASYCSGTPTNEGLLWAKLYEINWCIDFSTVPPTDIDNTGEQLVPSGYTLILPITVSDETTGKVWTIYLSLPHIYIHSQEPPTEGFTPEIIQPVIKDDTFPVYPLKTSITIVIKRPSREDNAVNIDLTSIGITLIDKYTGKEFSFEQDDINILDRVLTDSDTIYNDKDSWEAWADQEADNGHFMTLTDYINNNGATLQIPGSQNTYIVLRIDTSKYYGQMLPSYYDVRVNIRAIDPENSIKEWPRELYTGVKLKNDDGNGDPVVWYEYPLEGQTITLNLEQMFAGAFIKYAGGAIDYLPALKDTVIRYGLNYNQYTVELILNYFKDFWARENYRTSIELSYDNMQSGNVPPDIENSWYWELKAKDLDSTVFSQYYSHINLKDIDNMQISSSQKDLLKTGLYNPDEGLFYQIYQSVIMARTSNPDKDNDPSDLKLEGVIKTIIGDMSPDHTITVKLIAKPQGYENAPNDPDLFPIVTFKVDIITSTKPFIEYPNGDTVKVGIQDFSRVHDWNELTQLIGQPQGDLANDFSMQEDLKNSIFYYSYGDDSYTHNTYVRIFNPAGVNTKLIIKPVNTIVDPYYTDAFQDIAGNKFSIAPGIIMRQEYNEWEPANNHRLKLPLEIYYYPVPNAVTYELQLIDAITGEVYDTKTVTIIPYNTATPVMPFEYIQPQQDDNIDFWKLSDQLLLEGNTQTGGSKIYAGDTTQQTKPLYFWSYIQSKMYFNIKDIKVYIDGNPVQIEGIRILDTNTNDIPFKEGMRITPGMSIGVKVKIGEVTATIETNANGGKRITDRTFTYDYTLGKHKLKVEIITTDDKKYTREVEFNLYNSQGKHYVGRIIYPRPLSQVTTNEYYNNQLVVKFENLGEEFTYSSISVKVNGESVTPNDLKLIEYDPSTGTSSILTLTQGTLFKPGDVALIYLPTDKLFTGTINRIEITIHTQDGAVLQDKTVFALSDAFYLPYKRITILNIKDGSTYNTYYTDKIILLYTGYTISLENAQIKIDNTLTDDLIPVSLIRGETSMQLTKGTTIQSGDILIFQLSDKNKLPQGAHTIIVTLKDSQGGSTADKVRAQIYTQDWGDMKSIHITSPDKMDYYLRNKPLIITAVNEKAPFTIQTFTIKIDGQEVTPQKALKLGLTVEQLHDGVEVNHAETLYFEIDPTSIGTEGIETGAHTIEVTITTTDSETITDTKAVFLYDPLTPTNVILLNPTGDLPNLVTTLFAMGGYLKPTPDEQYIDLLIDWYPVSFTWDKGESPMTSISITIDGVTFTPGDGIDQVIIKTKDGAIIDWTANPDTIIRSGDVVTAYINFNTKNFDFHLFKLNPETGDYSIPVKHSLEVKVNGKTVQGEFDNDSGEVKTTTTKSLEYKTIERIEYVPTWDVKWKVQTIRYITYLEEWVIKIPIYYTKTWKDVIECKDISQMLEKKEPVPSDAVETCCATDKAFANKHPELCKCASSEYAKEHPDECSTKGGGRIEGKGLSWSCQPEYSQCCAVNKGLAEWSDFYNNPIDIINAQLIACACDLLASLFGMGCGCCGGAISGDGDITITNPSWTVRHSDTYCAGTFVTKILRLTNYIIKSGDGGSGELEPPGMKMPAGTTWQYVVNGQSVEIGRIDTTIKNKDGSVVSTVYGYGFFINGYNPYVVYSYGVNDNPGDSTKVNQYERTININLPSDLPIINAEDGQDVSMKQYVAVEHYFVKGVCESDMSYRIRKLLDYTIKVLVPELQYSETEIRYTDVEIREILGKKFTFQLINGELNLLKVLPYIESPSEAVPFWLFPNDFKVEGFMIPVHLTVYTSEEGEEIQDIKLYYDGQEVSSDKYLPVIIKKSADGIELIPYDQWDNKLDPITQFYIIYIPDKLEMGRHEIGVDLITTNFGTVGMRRDFEIKPAFNWELLLTSLPDTVYKEYGTTIPIYIKNKGMSFRYAGIKVYIDGTEVPVQTVSKLTSDNQLITLNEGDYVDVKDMIMFPLDISSLTPGEHELKVVVTTGFTIDISLTKKFKVEDEMKFYKISITSPNSRTPLIYDDNNNIEVYIKNEGDAITYGGVSLTIAGDVLTVKSVYKVTDTGLVPVSDGDTIDSQEVLKVVAELPENFEQVIPLQEAIISAGVLNKDTGEVLKDAVKTLITSEDNLSGYMITIQSPRPDTSIAKSVFTTMRVYVKNDRAQIIIPDSSAIKLRIDGVVVTPNWVKLLKTDGTMVDVGTNTVIDTGDIIVIEVPINTLEVGSHSVKVEVTGSGADGNAVEVSDESMFVIDDTPKDYSIRISSPKWKCPLVLPESMSAGVPVYITVIGDAMSIAGVEVNVNNKPYTPENIRIGKSDSIIDFTPGATAGHFDVIIFSVPQNYFMNNAMNIITVKVITTDGHIVTDTVRFALVIPSMKNYLQLVMPQEGQEYVRVPLKTTEVAYYTPEVKIGSDSMLFKRAENRFFYGVNDANTLIKSYNQLISLINKYPVGGTDDPSVRQLISSNSDYIRPFIQMIEWDADIEDLYNSATPGATLEGYKNFLQFYIDAGKFRFTKYDPNVVMRFKIVNTNAEKFGKIATISWRGLDGKIHTTNLILYKGIVIPEEITLFDFVMRETVANKMKVSVPIFYGFDYSGKDKVYQMEVEIVDKSVDAVLDKKTFTLRVSGKRFKEPIGFRLVYPMSIYSDYYKTSYTPITEWYNGKLPVTIEWYDYLYKFDMRNNKWFMGFNWVDEQGNGHLIGIGRDDNGYYYRYDSNVVYTTESDFESYIGSVTTPFMYDTTHNQPGGRNIIIWLPSLQKFAEKFGWTSEQLDAFKKSFVEESYTVDGKMGTNFVFIVYTATRVDTETVEQYNFADKGHIIWGYKEVQLELEPKYMDVDNDKIPDYIITPEKLQEAMSSPVWQKNDYYQEAYNSCGDGVCMVNGYKLDKLAHKQIVFTLKNMGSLVYSINDIRQDLRIDFGVAGFEDQPIFVLNAPSLLTPRATAEIWVVVDSVPTGTYTLSAYLQGAKAYRENWLKQFQETTGIDIGADTTDVVEQDYSIPINKCGDTPKLCMYYNRMVELIEPANGQEVYLENYANSFPYRFRLFLDGEYLLKEFTISLMRESKDSIFYLRYFDPQGGVVETEELIQQGLGNPTYIMKIIMNPNDRNDWQYITRIISSSGDVSEQVMPQDISSVGISNNKYTEPIVGVFNSETGGNIDDVYGQLGVPNFPEENIGLNIVSVEVVLENPNTHEVITLRDANADVTVGRYVQPRDNILVIDSPTSRTVGTDVPVQVVSTCMQAIQLMMMAESDLQIYSKENSEFIKQTLEGTCDIPFTEDYVNRKIRYIDTLPVGEFKVMIKIYDPTCSCVYELPPEAWEHMRPPIDSGITGGQTASGSEGGNNAGAVLPGVMASGTGTAVSQAVTKKAVLNPFIMKEYSIVNAGGYAWYMNQTTLKVGYGDVGGTIYLDDAVDKLISGQAVWNRASWYILLTKNQDGTGKVTIKYNSMKRSFNIDNMASFLGIDNDELVPIQGYLYFMMPSLDQILEKAEVILGESSQEYRDIEFMIEHIKSNLVTVDESRIAMFTYTGTAQGEDYNEYAVSITKPDKFIKIININEGTSSSYTTVHLNGYTLPVSIVNYGSSEITLKRVYIELYDNGEFATNPYIVESEEDVDGLILQPQGSAITINFDLKDYLLKTSSEGNIRKLALVAEDADGTIVTYSVYYIKVEFTDYAFTLIYPDSEIVDAIVNLATNKWYIPIKLRVTYEYLDDSTGETIRPPVTVNSITVKINGNTYTKEYNQEFNYGDVITFWVNLGELGDPSMPVTKSMIIEYTYSVEGAQGQQPATDLSLIIYPSTGLQATTTEDRYLFSDLVFGGTEFTLTNRLHKPIIQPIDDATTEFQLKEYTVEYTITVDETPLMTVKYYSDHVEWTQTINGHTKTYTLTYKNPPTTINDLQPGDSTTYTLYGLDNLQTESKTEYNELVNGLLAIASEMAGKTAKVEFQFTYTYTTIYNGEEVSTVYKTAPMIVTLKDYDPIISYPTSNSLLYIPKTVDQISIIMYNIGKNPMTIDLSTLSVKMGNIDLPLEYVKDSQGNTYTSGTVVLSDAGGSNPYIIIRVDTSNVIDGLYNLNIDFTTQESGDFSLRVVNLQVKKVDEVNMFEPEWDTINSDYTVQYGNDYITLPLTYPPEYYGVFGDIKWKDASDTPYFKALLYRIEPAEYDTPTWAGSDKVYSVDDGSLTGLLIDSLNNDNDMITQGETLGVMISKTSTVNIDGTDVPYSEFFKGVNKIRLIYTNPESDFNDLIVFTKYFMWDGTMALWLDFKYNGWYFDDFNWRIPVEIDPTAQIDSVMVGYVIKVTLDVSGNQELKDSLETLVDTDNDGVPDTPAWKTKQVGIRVTYYDPAFEDVNGDGTPDPAEAEVPFYIDDYDGTIATVYIKVPIIKPEDVGQRILNIYYYGTAYIEES